MEILRKSQILKSLDDFGKIYKLGNIQDKQASLILRLTFEAPLFLDLIDKITYLHKIIFEGIEAKEYFDNDQSVFILGLVCESAFQLDDSQKIYLFQKALDNLLAEY